MQGNFVRVEITREARENCGSSALDFVTRFLVLQCFGLSWGMRKKQSIECEKNMLKWTKYEDEK